MPGIMVETLAVIFSAAAALVSVVAALLKVRRLNESHSEDNLKEVTIKIGNETINLNASEHDARAAIARLQRDSEPKAVVH